MLTFNKTLITEVSRGQGLATAVKEGWLQGCVFETRHSMWEGVPETSSLIRGIGWAAMPPSVHQCPTVSQRVCPSASNMQTGISQITAPGLPHQGWQSRKGEGNRGPFYFSEKAHSLMHLPLFLYPYLQAPQDLQVLPLLNGAFTKAPASVFTFFRKPNRKSVSIYVISAGCVQKL